MVITHVDDFTLAGIVDFIKRVLEMVDVNPSTITLKHK